MNVKEGLSVRGSAGRQRGEEKDNWGEEDWSALHIDLWRQHNQTHHTLFEKGKRREGSMGK
jgi:hypothetical protein